MMQHSSETCQRRPVNRGIVIIATPIERCTTTIISNIFTCYRWADLWHQLIHAAPFASFLSPFSKSSYCRHAYEMMSTFFFFFFPSSSVGIVPASLLLATRAGGFKCFHLYSGFFSRTDPLSIGAIVFFNHSFQYYFLHWIYNKNSFSFIKDRNDEKASSKQ